MPEISRFYGIVIYMFYNEHFPPHFHVKYGDSEAVFSIETLSLLKGELPPRALGLVTEWAALHQKDLSEDWKNAINHRPLQKIPPLN